LGGFGNYVDADMLEGTCRVPSGAKW